MILSCHGTALAEEWTQCFRMFLVVPIRGIRCFDIALIVYQTNHAIRWNDQVIWIAWFVWYTINAMSKHLTVSGTVLSVEAPHCVRHSAECLSCYDPLAMPQEPVAVFM